jgi:aminoglycoside/choline kinase family phosphotransferase
VSEPRPELREALEGLHAGFRLETLPGDASTRRFHRLFLAEGATRIVMDYGAPFSGETDDVKLARIFEAARLPVARVLDVLPEAGCLLLEDLGDLTLELALQRGGRRAESPGTLYARAVELAADIATRGTSALAASERSKGPALDAERFRFEMRFFLEHFIQGLRQAPVPPRATEEALDRLADEVAGHPRVMCHRDYHSRNIMVRGDGSLAMVDIQDARWGPDTYDVASLLHDAYAEIGELDVKEGFERYVRLLPPGQDFDALRERFHLAATQRMIKALGTFGYQIVRLGRERYRDAIPRTLARLDRSLPAHPKTRPLHATLSEAGIFA